LSEKKQLGRGTLQELMWLLMNVLALEEHLAETPLDDLSLLDARAMRAEVLEKITHLLSGKKPSETMLRRYWCIIKHLLLTSIHSFEVAGQIMDTYPDESWDMMELSRVTFSKAEELLVKYASQPIEEKEKQETEEEKHNT
jgi:hypothetical protein